MIGTNRLERRLARVRCVAALAAGFLCAAPAAQATLVEVGFAGGMRNVGVSQPVDTSMVGKVFYDDAGLTGVGVEGIVISSMNVSFSGNANAVFQNLLPDAFSGSVGPVRAFYDNGVFTHLAGHQTLQPDWTLDINTIAGDGLRDALLNVFLFFSKEVVDGEMQVVGPTPVNPTGPGGQVPAPATLALFGLGLAGLGLMRRRRRMAKSG